MNIAQTIASGNLAKAQDLVVNKLAEKSLEAINARRGEMLRDVLKDKD